MVNNICKEFHVSETWLRTGTGEMFLEVSKEDEISEFVEQVLTDESADFKRRFIAALSKLDSDGWAALEELVENTARQHAADPPDQRAIWEAEADEFAAMAREQFLMAQHAADPPDQRAIWEAEADEFAAMAREQFLSEKRRESQASSAKNSGGPGGVA